MMIAGGSEWIVASNGKNSRMASQIGLNTMSRRGNIRGPHSALTDFLASKGINAAEITQRHQERVQTEVRALSTGESNILEDTADGIAEPLESTSLTRSKRKRAAAKSGKRQKKKDDSDKEKYDGPSIGRDASRSSKYSGQIQFCIECSARFSVTQFSKGTSREGYLCNKCGYSAGSSPEDAKVRRKAAIARKKKAAQAKLEGEDLVPKLQDLCIKLLAKYINDVEALGEIGEVNMDKICQIISKKRSLTNDTLGLFLDVSKEKLNLYDCSKIDPDNFIKIAQLCPNLKSITLKYCGRITDPVISFYVTHLKKLDSLITNGPFLVTASAWQYSFVTLGSRLETLVISDTSRFDVQTALKLAEHCPNIRKLGLSRLTQMNDELVKALAKLSGLIELDLSWPGDVITDDSIIELLNQNGPTLTSINLDGCREVTEKTLRFITSSCPLLAELSLQQCERISDEGFTTAFNENVVLQGLINVNLERCLGLKDNAIQSLLRHSARHLQKLNLNSLDELTKCTFEELGSLICPLLEILDTGFVRVIDDEICTKIINACPSLRILKVFGCSRLTETVDLDLRTDIKLIGREADFL